MSREWGRNLHVLCTVGLCERLARANAYQDDVLARVVVVEPGARARVRDAAGDQLGVLSDLRGVSEVCRYGHSTTRACP